MNVKAPREAEQTRMSYATAPPDFKQERAVSEITDWDLSVFREITSILLNEEQERRIGTVDQTYPRQREVLAIHWHPEWISMDLIRRRIGTMFPNHEEELIIPTQHNQIMVWGDYAGAEVDCYASGFQRKVQLLVHFRADRLEKATVLKSMLEHTFKYRSSQMFAFLDTILKPEFEDRLQLAVEETGASDRLVEMLRFYMARLQQMIYDHESELPDVMIKNKLLNEYMDAQRERHPDNEINRLLLLLKAVKKQVKANFPLNYFFRATQVIEEVRGLDGGVVIPHPEQFWPILLANYDVDGWEVWNPQSQEYTPFLIAALHNQNKIRRSGHRPLLVFMGDDTHLSAKIRSTGGENRLKTEREVGLQPAWEDIAIRKNLSLAGAGRAQVIQEYRSRLG